MLLEFFLTFIINFYRVRAGFGPGYFFIQININKHIMLTMVLFYIYRMFQGELECDVC